MLASANSQPPRREHEDDAGIPMGGSGASDALVDRFGRRFPYVRLSLTDVCNFRCGYCLPNGWTKTGPMRFLDAAEIGRLVRALADLGVWKIRLTGGEPTLRPDFTDIAQLVAATPGIRRVAFTTNGYRLAERAQEWRDAGLSAVNISIDSLDPARFRRITGHDRLDEVMAGVEAARAAGFETIKINVVLLRGLNDRELPEFLAHARANAVSLRFIELMQTGLTKAYFDAHHLSGQVLLDRLNAEGWTEVQRVPGAGPAREFAHPDAVGSVGLIAPYSRDFCAGCNRLRITARGRLQLCLFGDGAFDLRPLMQADDDREALQARIQALLGWKTEAHRLHDGNPGATPHLASIGG